jgi:hypothetical protein
MLRVKTVNLTEYSTSSYILSTPLPKELQQLLIFSNNNNTISNHNGNNSSNNDNNNKFNKAYNNSITTTTNYTAGNAAAIFQQSQGQVSKNSNSKQFLTLSHATETTGKIQENFVNLSIFNIVS